MVKEEIKLAIEVLKNADKDYIINVLKKNKYQLEYDLDYQGWFIGNKNIVNYFFKEGNTYLNPKELEGFIEDIIEEEIFRIEDVAEDFISYFESKYGLDDVTEDRICSNIDRDCEFHIFEHIGLSDEVIKQLKNKGIDVK